jgi:hypothetical protein
MIEQLHPGQRVARVEFRVPFDGVSPRIQNRGATGRHVIRKRKTPAIDICHVLLRHEIASLKLKVTPNARA